MIARLLTDLSGRVAHADVVGTTDDSLTVVRGADGSPEVTASSSAQVQIRLADQERVGWAGGAVADAESIMAAALRSLAVADSGPLHLPTKSPLPAVVTADPSVALIGTGELAALTGELSSRLARSGRQVEVWAERSTGTIEVANSRGVDARYDVSLVGLGAVVRSAGGPPSALRVHWARSESIDAAAVNALVDEVEAVLAPPPLTFGPVAPAERVWFGPRAVRALLLPVLARHQGERWLCRREPIASYDERITIADEPLVPLRPGSRPIDDDGVPTRRLILIERGRPMAGIVDLALGARYLRPSTGHGYRRGYAGPRVGFSNVLVEPGTDDTAALAAAAGDGIYVPNLTFGPAPNPDSGVFRVSVPWAVRLSRGEPVGRIEGAWLAGNVFELLDRVVSIGADATWIGAVRVPSMVLDRVAAVTR